MNKINFGRLLTVILAGVIVTSTHSCIDKDYDLSQIDNTIVVLKGSYLPIGELSPISISDFLTIEEGQTVFNTDASGNFYIGFDGGEAIDASFTIPEIDLSDGENKVESQTISMTMPEVIAGKSTSFIQQYLPEYYNRKISYEELNGSPISIKKTIHMGNNIDLSPYINDIKELELDTEITYQFILKSKDLNGNVTNSYGGAAYIEEGFTIDFPDWLLITKKDNIDSYTIENQENNKNVLHFTKDLAVSADVPVTFSIGVNKIEIPSDFIVDGGKDSEGNDCKILNIDANDDNNMIIIDGNIYTKASDFTMIPKDVEINMNFSFSSLKIKSALVSLNLNKSLSDQSLEIPEMSDIFNDKNIVLDLYDPAIYFTLNNRTPLDINVYAHLFAYKNHQMVIDTYFSENGANAPFTIPANYNGSIGFSRRGEGDNIALPAIGEMFKSIPDEVAIKDIRVSSSNDYIRITPGTDMGCSVNYRFETPLSFGSDLSLNFEYEISELKVDLNELAIKSAKISFEVINTIPLSLSVDARILNSDGTVANDINISANGSIQAGSIESPSTSEVTISLSSKTNAGKLDCLKLMMKASCPSECEGIALNKNQGIEIKNLYISLPEGVELKMDNILEPKE